MSRPPFSCAGASHHIARDPVVPCSDRPAIWRLHAGCTYVPAFRDTLSRAGGHHQLRLLARLRKPSSFHICCHVPVLGAKAGHMFGWNDIVIKVCWRERLKPQSQASKLISNLMPDAIVTQPRRFLVRWPHSRSRKHLEGPGAVHASEIDLVRNEGGPFAATYKLKLI